MIFCTFIVTTVVFLVAMLFTSTEDAAGVAFFVPLLVVACAAFASGTRPVDMGGDIHIQQQITNAMKHFTPTNPADIKPGVKINDVFYFGHEPDA